MTRLLLQAAAGLVFLLVVLGVALFVPAGTPSYWQAWVLLGTFGGASLLITIDLARRDPVLLARRVKAGPLAEPTAKQKVIQSCAGLSFVAIFLLAGFDRRAGWSRVPDAAAIAGDVLVALGLGIVAVVYCVNTFTSAVVTVESGQTVVSTGPYAVVRHPMYTGALVMLVGLPLALASCCAFAGVPPLVAVIVWRLFDEERLLARDLPGYADYRGRVRHRLLPFLW